MMGKVQAETHPSGFGLDLADKWPSYESRSSDAQGYAIRGISNLGNTCYMSAVLQCLFVLGKLRAGPKESFGMRRLLQSALFQSWSYGRQPQISYGLARYLD
jgi:ubiquitin carboxyl-terminal hydrolase 16/45